MRYPFAIDIYDKGHCSEHIEGTFGRSLHVFLREFYSLSITK